METIFVTSTTSVYFTNRLDGTVHANSNPTTPISVSNLTLATACIEEHELPASGYSTSSPAFVNLTSNSTFNVSEQKMTSRGGSTASWSRCRARIEFKAKPKSRSHQSLNQSLNDTASTMLTSTGVNCPCSNGLSVTANFIFCALYGTSVVHVYQRPQISHDDAWSIPKLSFPRGNTTNPNASVANSGISRLKQVHIVPFAQRVTCCTLIADDTILAVGSEGGSIFLWEIYSGRLSIVPDCHMQAVTDLTSDSTNNYLLSASLDGSILVWCLADLVQFTHASYNPMVDHSLDQIKFHEHAYRPLHRLTLHRKAIRAIKVTSSRLSCCFAVSISDDLTAIVWDFRRGFAIRSYLFTCRPVCLALDGIDRGFYVGFDDGSILPVSYYTHVSNGGDNEDKGNGIQSILSENIRQNDLVKSSSDDSNEKISQEKSNLPLTENMGNVKGACALINSDQFKIIELDQSKCWKVDTEQGACLDLTFTWDQSRLLASYQDGTMGQWDIGNGTFSRITKLTSSVNNVKITKCQNLIWKQDDDSCRGKVGEARVNQVNFVIGNIMKAGTLGRHTGHGEIDDDTFPDDYKIQMEITSAYNKTFYMDKFVRLDDEFIRESYQSVVTWKCTAMSSCVDDSLDKVSPVKQIQALRETEAEQDKLNQLGQAYTMDIKATKWTNATATTIQDQDEHNDEPSNHNPEDANVNLQLNRPYTDNDRVTLEQVDRSDKLCQAKLQHDRLLTVQACLKRRIRQIEQENLQLRRAWLESREVEGDFLI